MSKTLYIVIWAIGIFSIVWAFSEKLSGNPFDGLITGFVSMLMLIFATDIRSRSNV